MKNFVIFLSVLVLSASAQAQTVKEKKARDAVDAAAVQAAKDIKDCGTSIKVVFDWTAFDGLDWSKHKKDDYYGTENRNISSVGKGINKLCADKDYKAALGKISTITYKSSDNSKIRVQATVSGNTLIFENYALGSARDANDYTTAAKAAL